MRSRYAGLEQYNEAILSVTPGAEYLWRTVATLVHRNYQFGENVVELGPGEDHSTEAVLIRIAAHMGSGRLKLIDISQKMLARCKRRLGEQGKHARFVCRDAARYLTLRNPASFVVIYSAWTAHNFTEAYRQNLWPLIASRLMHGGALVLMDKVYPGDAREAGRLFKLQMDRYAEFLAPEVYREIHLHEVEDYGPDYRLEEMSLRNELQKHFSEVRVVDRVERELIIVCKK